jgi:hypothetical protein
MLIKCFLAFEAHMGREGLRVDYNTITQRMFDQFWISTNYKSSQLAPPQTPHVLHRCMIHHLPKCFTARSKLMPLSSQF